MKSKWNTKTTKTPSSILLHFSEHGIQPWHRCHNFPLNQGTCIIISKWCLQAVENVWLKYITKFCHLVTALVEKWRTKLSNPSITCFESAEKQMLDKSIISVAWVAKNMESWFKDSDICNNSRGYRIKWQKSLKRSRVFPAKRVEREEVINNRFIHELKLTFLLNFLHLSEEIDTEKSLERAATPATLKEDTREAHTFLVYCLSDLLSSREYPSIDRWYPNSISFTFVSFYFE